MTGSSTLTILAWLSGIVLVLQIIIIILAWSAIAEYLGNNERAENAEEESLEHFRTKSSKISSVSAWLELHDDFMSLHPDEDHSGSEIYQYITQSLSKIIEAHLSTTMSFSPSIQRLVWMCDVALEYLGEKHRMYRLAIARLAERVEYEVTEATSISALFCLITQINRHLDYEFNDNVFLAIDKQLSKVCSADIPRDLLYSTSLKEDKTADNENPEQPPKEPPIGNDTPEGKHIVNMGKILSSDNPDTEEPVTADKN